MMIRSIFLLVTLVVTVAGRKHLGCIPGAELNEKSICQCKDGFIGQPDLCCYRPASSEGCFLAGDPYAVSYNGAKMNMNFPCGTHISSSYSLVNEKKCRVNVYTSSKHMDGASVFYTSNILVDIAYRGKKIGHMFNFQEKPPVATLSDEYGNVRTLRLSPGSSKLPTPSFPDVTVFFSTGMNLITLTACEITINMRPVPDNKKEQNRAPGVCITHVKGVAQINERGVCSLRQEDVADKDKFLNKAIVPFKNYYLNRQPELHHVTDPASYDVCNKFSYFIMHCEDDSTKRKVMKSCAFLLMNADVRFCMWVMAPKVVKHSIVMDYFNQCVLNLCEALRGDMTMCTDGTLHDKYLSKCAPSLRRKCRRFARLSAVTEAAVVAPPPVK